MNYFNDITRYICDRLWNKYHIKIGCVSDDRRNVQFITDKKCSHTVNIFRLTCREDLEKCVEQIGYELCIL